LTDAEALTGTTREVRAPHGFGLLPRSCRIRTDPPFARFLSEQIAELAPRDLACDVALHGLSQALAGNMDGIIAEFGVYRGESVNRIAALAHPRAVYGFDSFEGLPEDWIPGGGKGAFSLKGEPPAVLANVSLVKGWFEETLPPFLGQHPGRPFAFIHIDSDLYSSCKTVLSLCADRIVPGTIIVFDEIWNHKPFYYGEMRALFEFIQETGTRFEWIGYGYDTGCATRIPGLFGRAFGLLVRSVAALRLLPPRLKVAAALRIL
jgi:methyltransferase family protein